MASDDSLLDKNETPADVRYVARLKRLAVYICTCAYIYTHMCNN